MGEPSDEMLMRLADGELPEPDAARLVARVAAEPALAARYALFATTRRAVERSFAPVLGQKVPDALVAAVLAADAAASAPPDNVVPLTPRPRPVAAPPPQPARAWRPLLAASVAALLAAPVGYLAGRGGMGPEAALRDPLAGARTFLAETLESAPSGTRRSAGGVSVQPFATHPVAGGACRDFLLEAPSGALLGIACREPSGWALRASVAVTGGDALRTASPDHPVLAVVLEGLGAPPPLDAEREAQLLRRGWR